MQILLVRGVQKTLLLRVARADLDVHGLSAMLASIADSSFCTK